MKLEDGKGDILMRVEIPSEELIKMLSGAG